eukprot:11052001-Lingulodinium_polyedra.AAC.1
MAASSSHPSMGQRGVVELLKDLCRPGESGLDASRKIQLYRLLESGKQVLKAGAESLWQEAGDLP